MATITSANSQFVLFVPDVNPVPQVMQGYATDDAFTAEAYAVAEAVMGVDGFLSAGYTPNPKPVTIMLQADSPSLAFLDTWVGAMESQKEVYFGDATITLPSTGKVYTLGKGVITSAQRLPAAKKTLQPVPYVLTFESIQSANI